MPRYSEGRRPAPSCTARARPRLSVSSATSPLRLVLNAGPRRVHEGVWFGADPRELALSALVARPPGAGVLAQLLRAKLHEGHPRGRMGGAGAYRLQVQLRWSNVSTFLKHSCS